MGTKESDVKFDFDPWDGTPGDAYDKFEIRLLNNGSKTDDRGWSLSDHLLGDDEGGPNIGAPAMPRPSAPPTHTPPRVSCAPMPCCMLKRAVAPRRGTQWIPHSHVQSTRPCGAIDNRAFHWHIRVGERALDYGEAETPGKGHS